MLGQGSFAAGPQAVSAALAGIFDDIAKGVIVAEPLEQKVPERDEGRKSPLIKGQFRRIQPGGLQELGKVALELAGGEAGALQLGWLGLLRGGAGLWLGGRVARFGFRLCHICMYYAIHTYYARSTPVNATVAKSNCLPLASHQRLPGQGL